MNKNFLNFIRFYRTSAKAGMVLPENLKNILRGLMLGDTHAERPSLRHNTRLQFIQSNKNDNYIYHLFLLFKDFVGSPPKVFNIKGGLPQMKGKVYTSIKFYTLSIACFNVFRELFYNEVGVKILPLNYYDIITPVGLAYWFIDDGYNHYPYLMFCTESFTWEENLRLRAILKDKFGINCDIIKYDGGGHKCRLRVLGSSREDFIKLVKPHMLEMFYYKLENKK